jgi:hypothetical protein
MDYSYYSINEVPLITYGMIAITTGVLVSVSMSDNGKESESGPSESKSEPEPEPEPEPQEEQLGGRRKHKGKLTKHKRKMHHKTSPKRRK